ncbi:MAG: hypothetical protein HOE48_01770, partial [Candidatus Latescibacteria bacterium]|nr:hypothetical protein [Candidatus Latescibacterota bacterium]
ALNAAKESATGAYIVHTALGGQWDTSKLERQVFHLEDHPTYASSTHHLTLQAEAGQTQRYLCDAIKNYGAKIGGFSNAPWAPGTIMLTKEASLQLGAHRNIDDTIWEYALRQIDRNTAPIILEEDLAIWRSGSSNTNLSLVASSLRHRFLKPYIDKTETTALFSEHILVSQIHGDLVRNALYQKNDDLDTAHQICQTIGKTADAPEICYWHGLIHRREPDFKNAHSWFQKSRNLAANNQLYQATYNFLQRAIQMPDYGDTREVALQFWQHLRNQGTWDALYFLNLCESAIENKNSDLQKLLEDIQAIEFETLFQWTFQKAIGTA